MVLEGLCWLQDFRFGVSRMLLDVALLVSGLIRALRAVWKQEPGILN